MLARTAKFMISKCPHLVKAYWNGVIIFLADLSGPPLYGHIMCRMAVQPLSVLHPLVEGMLTVKPLGENTALKNVQSRLQAGNLTCYMNVDVHKCPSREEVLMQIPITSVSISWLFSTIPLTIGFQDCVNRLPLHVPASHRGHHWCGRQWAFRHSW